VAEFTFHNVVLPDGTQTKPGYLPTAETGICQAALRDLRAFTGPAAAVADLGCLEGGYAAEFARCGYDVTGIEAHPDNFACSTLVRDALGLPNLRFERGDVREVLPGREFDAVFCCGLLYHLDAPAAFLRLLGAVTRRVLILQTHYSLTSAAENEGHRGGWFGESPGGRWASHGNPRSFWLTKRDLLAAIRDAGFPLVFEQDDYRDAGTGVYRDAAGNDEPDGRSMFVGVKEPDTEPAPRQNLTPPRHNLTGPRLFCLPRFPDVKAAPREDSSCVVRRADPHPPRAADGQHVRRPAG
jgi:SAM-dependent methyltransferase